MTTASKILPLVLGAHVLMATPGRAAQLDCALVNDTAPDLVNKHASEARLQSSFRRVREQIRAAMLSGDSERRRECSRTAGFYLAEMQRRQPLKKPTAVIEDALAACPRP